MATGRLPDPNTAPVTAKGDLYTYSTVPAKLAVGNNGDTLVADSSASTGLRWQGSQAAGKNAIINGDFRIWQRGTSFTGSSSFTYSADRFVTNYDATPTSATLSQQTFTPGTAPVAGYEGQFFHRNTVTTRGSANYYIMSQRIEDVRTFAGQTITFSFWAKLNSGSVTASRLRFGQNFGSGGSADVLYDSGYSVSLTGSWQRFTRTITLNSISGKTIGTGSYLFVDLIVDFTGANAVDVWGWQLESGSVATAFQTATGTLAGELAACQRYYFLAVDGTTKNFNLATYFSATTLVGQFYFPVTMRSAPTLVATSGTNYYSTEINSVQDLFNSLTILRAHTNGSGWFNNTEVAGTAGQASQVYTWNASASIAFNSEL